MTQEWMSEVLKGLVLHIEPIKLICELGVPFTEGNKVFFLQAVKFLSCEVPVWSFCIGVNLDSSGQEQNRAEIN